MPNDGLGQFRRKLTYQIRKPAEPYVKALKYLTEERKRSGREDDARDITQYIVPRKGMYYMSEGFDTPEKRREQKMMIDSAPRKAVRNATAGIMGGMTSKARPWIRLALRDDDLMKDDATRQWLHNTTNAMLEALQLSNFYTAVSPWYKELLCFGMPGGMMELADFETLVRFYTFAFGETYYAVNERGIIDTMYRRYVMTAKNVVDKFGETNVSKKILGDYQASDRQYKPHTICHCIKPNEGRDTTKIDNQNMPYESVYWEDQEISQTLNYEILGMSGFEEFPVFAPRWDTVTTQSVYGDGPGQDELGNCMMIQALNEDDLKARHLETDPPMRIPPDYNDKLSLLPGAQNVDPTLRAGGNGKGIDKLFEHRFDYNATFVRIEDTRNQIFEGFFNDLFRLLIDRPGAQPPTAYEIAQRKEEKIALLSPVLDRIHTEGLAPLVQRTFGIMSRAGAIERPPEQIQGAELKVEFISTLAQAQKLIGLQPIEMVLGFVGQNAELWPSMLDKIDSDEVLDQYVEVTGAPPKIINDDKTVAAIRDQRALAQQAQQLMEQMSQGAQIAKDASGADLGALQEGLS